MRKFRDSGIDWIGRIPENWKTNKFKHLFRIKKIIAGKLGYDVLSVTQQGIKVKNITSNEGQIANDYSNYQLVFPNDFVMNHMDLLTGYVDVSKQDGVTSPDYRTFYAIHPIEVINQYYLYIFQFCYKTRLFYNLGQGVSNFGRWRLPAEQQKEFVLPYPPVKEQQQIVDYLDKKCGEIDSLIALQEQMIEKLKAYKQSVITEAVTKGLDPNAKLVPSGIDWISEIPEGWSKIRLKDIFVLKPGTTPKSFEEGLNEEENLVNWFTPSDVSEQNCILTQSDRHLNRKVVKNEGIKLYPIGSLIFVGIGASAGKIGYAAVEGYSNQQITALIPKKGQMYSKYFYYYMLADSKRIRDNAFFTTLPIINNSYLSGISILNPPISEQQAIATYLDEKCADIDHLIVLKQQKIESLKDYKKSVIYEAVTGKTTIE